MLILGRNICQSLIIGDDIRVTILSIKGHQARIGIDAPKEISVHREEIYNQIKDKEEVKHPGNVKRFKIEDIL